MNWHRRGSTVTLACLGGKGVYEKMEMVAHETMGHDEEVSQKRIVFAWTDVRLEESMR